MSNTTRSGDRPTVLEHARTLKMATSAHAYVRGNTVQFYEWLATSRSAASLPDGPAVWICGDCHVGNLGPIADVEGHVDIQIRDLDQTVIGNPAHDLVRLGLSLASAARGSDLPGVTTARMVEQMVRGYELALRDPSHDEHVPEPGVVRTVKHRAFGRRWRHLARERLEDVKPTIPLGKRFWVLDDDERQALEALLDGDEVRRLVLSLHGKDAGTRIELLDAAYWMKGCSSLGKLRFAALLGTPRKGASTDLALVDVKEAGPTAAPCAPGASCPTDHAERVVAGARALSPNLGDRMAAGRIMDRPVIVRELMPQDLKLEVDQFTRDEAVVAAHYLAYVVGRAHGRQMDGATRDAWRRELERHHPGDLDAPSWLWSSVVELAANHEAGYLDHCRRYAMSEAS